MAEGGTPDQELTIKFSVDAEAALAKWAEIEKTTEKYKQELQALASEGGKSLLTLAEAMKQVYAETTRASAKQIADSLKMKGPEEQGQAKEVLAKAEADITEYNKRMSEAVQRTLAEINAASAQSAKQRTEDIKNMVNQEKLLLKQEEDARKQQVANEKANLNAAKAAQQEYVAAWKSGIPVMSAGAKAFGDQVQQTKSQIQQLAATTGQSFSQIGQQMVQGGKNINVVKQAIRELNSEASNTPSIFSRVGGAIQVALGIGLEQVVMRVIRAIIDGFKAAAEAGFEYAQALVRLQIGTNLLQKAGLNTTIKETLALIDELNQKFPVFTRKSIIEGVGYLQILSQNLGLSTKQMKDLSEVSGALAVILGKDVGEATKEIALFLSSGYGEALQRAGILASKASVEHELLAMGIKEGYNSVDQATRAQAGYNIIMQQASEIVKKAEDAQKGSAFALVRAKTAWEGLTNTVGIKLTPVLAFLADTIIPNLAKSLEGLAGIFALVIAEWMARLSQLVAGFRLLYSYIENGPKNLKGLDDLQEKLSKVFSMEGYKKAVEATRQFFLPDVFTKFTDDAIGAGNAADEAAAKIAQATEDLHTKLLDEQERFKNESENLWMDYQRDIEKINRDGLFRQEQLFTDFIRSIAQIEAKLSEDIYKENAKYEADVADVQRDYASRRADVEQKYRDRELKAQRDFEEKMRRLREDFILDMEDALRERDARQVLRLIRQFNVNQDRLKRERDQEHEDLQREYRQEIKDLEKQRQERLAALAREHQARIAALQRQAQIEREQAWLKYQQEMEDLRRNLENQKAERAIRYEEQKADLEKQTKERLEQIAKGLMDEYSLTQTMLDGIMALYRAKYGPGGELEGYYLYVISMINAMNQAISAAIGMGFGTFTNQKIVPGGPIHGYATGGSFVASSPTIAKFGEVPEVVTAVPINQMSKMPSVGRSGKSNSSRLAIDLFLSPDLEARIIDKTLDINADVMVDIQRRR